MVDAPPDEVATLLEGGPADFVATRTARVRALRAEGRREDAAALAKVRKPLRLTWVLIDVQRSRPDLVTVAVDAAEALAHAQSGGGGRARPLLRALRDALDGVTEAAVEVAPGDGVEAGLLARQVVGDPAAREAWGEGRLLAPPVPDTEGGIADPASAGLREATSHGTTDPGRPRKAGPRGRGSPTAGRRGRGEADASPPGDGSDREAEREREEVARREAARRAAREERVCGAKQLRDEAAEALAQLEADLADLEDEVDRLSARRDAARSATEAARDELAARDADVIGAREGPHP